MTPKADIIGPLPGDLQGIMSSVGCFSFWSKDEGHVGVLALKLDSYEVSSSDQNGSGLDCVPCGLRLSWLSPICMSLPVPWGPRPLGRGQPAVPSLSWGSLLWLGGGGHYRLCFCGGPLVRCSPRRVALRRLGACALRL